MLEDDERPESMNDLLNTNEKEKKSLLTKSEYSESSYTSSRSPSPESELESNFQPVDTRFAQPPVSRFKRTSLLIILALLCWLAFSMRANLLNAKKKPNVVHASRYSKEYKFRPAASPVVTETLKDGRTRLRGALPEQTAAPPPVKKQKRPRAGKAGGKRNFGGTKSKRKVVNQRKK